MSFDSLYTHGFARVAACTTDVFVADPARNARSVIEVTSQLSAEGVAVAVFPELALTGYAIDDLFGQDVVLDAVHEGLDAICQATAAQMVIRAAWAASRRAVAPAFAIHRSGCITHRGAGRSPRPTPRSAAASSPPCRRGRDRPRWRAGTVCAAPIPGSP
jgi:hypothetical protein